MWLILIALIGVGLGACAGASPGADTADTASERGDRTRGAAQGDRSAQTKPEAMNQAGNESEAKAAYASGDYIRAMLWYRKAAEQGNARCADQAGGMYQYGTWRKLWPSIEKPAREEYSPAVPVSA